MLDLYVDYGILGQRREGFKTSPALHQNGSCKDRIMANKALPSPEILRQLLRYELDTGKLFWRKRSADFFPSELACKRWNILFAEQEAFAYVGVNGYCRGAVQNKSLLAHRVAWAILHGNWPKCIDHINGDRSDNRPINIRDVTNQQNNLNMKRDKRNSSGFQGVTFHKASGKWRAVISYAGVRQSLGYFHDKDAAILARKFAEQSMGYHVNHGRVS